MRQSFADPDDQPPKTEGEILQERREKEAKCEHTLASSPYGLTISQKTKTSLWWQRFPTHVWYQLHAWCTTTPVTGLGGKQGDTLDLICPLVLLYSIIRVNSSRHSQILTNYASKHVHFHVFRTAGCHPICSSCVADGFMLMLLLTMNMFIFNYFQTQWIKQSPTWTLSVCIVGNERSSLRSCVRR